MKTILLALVFAAITASAQQSDFTWVSSTKGNAVFTAVKSAFTSELTADRSDQNTGVVPMTVKFIDRVGLRSDFALVIIGEKETQTSPYAAYRAFSFDLRTKAKTPIRTKDLEWMSMWRLEKVTRLTSPDDTDIIFQFLDCTECEAGRLLSSIHYVPNKGWELRQWRKNEGAAILIGSDPQYGDEGVSWYDCLHAISDVNGDGLDDVIVRCRESLQPDLEKPSKHVTSDTTTLYTTKGGHVSSTTVDKRSELFNSLQKTLCATDPKSVLCRPLQRR